MWCDGGKKNCVDFHRPNPAKQLLESTHAYLLPRHGLPVRLEPHRPGRLLLLLSRQGLPHHHTAPLLLLLLLPSPRRQAWVGLQGLRRPAPLARLQLPRLSSMLVGGRGVGRLGGDAGGEGGYGRRAGVCAIVRRGHVAAAGCGG